MITMARAFLILAVPAIPLALVPAHSWAQDEPVLDQARHPRMPPGWDAKFDQRPLSIPITAQERQLIVAAMDAQPEINTSAFYKATRNKIAHGKPMTLGDVIFVNRPLMEYQRVEPDEARALLRRLRAAASAMAVPPPPPK